MKRKRLLFAAIALVAGALGFNAYAQDAGTYYIQNVGTGKWLGPGNKWGTQASVMNHADYWKLAKNSDGVFTLESVVSNGGTSYYLSGTYCDGGATNFTFTAIAGKENTYSIANASGGYLTTNGKTVDVSATDGSAEASQWKLWSEKDMSDGMAAATVENPFDATYLIKDHDLGRNNRDYSTAWSNTGATEPKSSMGGENAVFSVEAFHKTFDVNQTISGVPNGVYGIKVNGFYRQDGEDTNLPYVYANDQNTTLPARTGSENNMQDAAVSFVAGNYLSNPVYVQVTDGKLKVGVKTEGTSCWSIFKNFHLSYYGDVTLAEVLLAEYVKAYNEALAEAQGYQNVDMFDADKAALNTAITNNTVDLSSATEESLVTATANLKAAAAAAAKAQTNYAAYQNIANAVNGQTNVNISSLIANLGFEEGNLTGWTSENGGGVANNNNFSGKVGGYFVERWQNGVALGSGSLTHDAITLPAGLYSITTNAQNIEQYNSNAAGTGYFFCVNDVQKEIGAAGTYTVVVKYTEPTEVTLKFLLDNCTGNWISCDNIIITYVGEDFPEVALVEGKMNANVNAAQVAAKTAYDANPSADTYNAILDAVAAAQASVDAYQKLGPAIAKIDAALAAATSATENTDEYQAIKTAYNNGSIADADIPDNVISAYEAVIPVIKSQTAASADFTFAIQNQSFEYGDMTGWTATASSDTGVRETANATYAAEGTDGSYLFNTWWQGVPIIQTVEGLPNGEYTLTASVASDGATIYLLGNGEHNEGIETGGEYPSKGVMQEATFTFLVKDGNATIGAVGGADGTAGEHKDYVEAGYWWYKVDNFRLVKNRDLTPEEEFVAATPEDYAALNEAIETAEGYVLGFDQDDYAPYNNVEALEALAAAKAIDQEANNAQEDVQAATAAITGATWTANSNEVNAVYDGTFANAENNGAPAGWTMTNNDLGGSYHARAFVGDDRLAEFNNTKSAFYIRFDGTNSTKGSLYKYGETSGYTMPLKASTVYYVSADLAGWGQKDKTIRINVGGPSGFEGTYEDATMSIRADQTDDAPIHVKFFFTTGEAGDYRISLQNPGANVDNAAVISNIEIKRAPEVTVTGTLAAGKYATRIFPFVPEKTENISFYSCEAVDANGKTLTLAIVDENELKANTPYILENATSEEIDITQTGFDTHKNDTYTEGWLTGVYAEGLYAPVGSYVLQTHGEKQSFYIVKQENYVDLTPYRAYLSVPEDVNGNGVKEFYLDGDDITAINALDALTSGTYEGIYTVDGVKLNRIEKGVNILKMSDGTTRKVVVK